MRRLERFSTGLALATAAATLALPPGSSAWVADWADTQTGVVPEFDLELWAAATIAVTSAVLYGARPHALVVADTTITATNATDTLNATAHGLLTGDGPVRVSNVGGALPGGLSAATNYWVIRTGTGTFKLAASLQDALAGIVVPISSDGSGTTTLSDVATTQRLEWSTHDGLLGLAGNGSISLAAGQGYSKRIPHSPRVVAYALVATLDTGAISAALYPIQDR